MTRRTAAACLWFLAALACGCHTPAYEMARSTAGAEIQRSCLASPVLELWTVGSETYFVTARCTRPGTERGPDGKVRVTHETRPITYSCRGNRCVELDHAGDWTRQDVSRTVSEPAVR